MPLYSLHHSSIAMGRPDAIGKAAARVRYVMRAGAATAVVEARTGLRSMKPSTIAAFCAERECQAGRNGRVAETIMVALPREADHDQRVELLRALAEHVAKGEAPYIAAIHDAGKDAANPHAHLVVFEQLKARQPGQRGRTGKVIRLSEDGALERLRADWAEIHNRMMAAWGIAALAIDHRSHAARGVDRLPAIHEGPAIRAMAAKGITPTSAERADRRGRLIAWPNIDEGITRAETNALVRAFNAAQAQQENQPHGRTDRLPCPAPGDNPRLAEADGGGPDADRRPRPAAGRDIGPVRGPSRQDGRAPEGAGSHRAVAGLACPASAVAADWPGPGDRGRYRPSRLRALTARLLVVGRSLAAVVAAVDWRRLTARPMPRWWGKVPEARGDRRREAPQR